MAEGRRPTRRPGSPAGARRPGAGGAGRGRGRPGGAGARRAPPPRQESAGPSPVVITLIVLPILGILGVGGYKILGPSEPEPVVQDDNADLQALIAEVGDLEKRGTEVVAAIRNEEPGAKARAQQLIDELYAWEERWQSIMADYYVDEERQQLEEEYAGYDKFRRDVNILRNDLVRIGGF